MSPVTRKSVEITARLYGSPALPAVWRTSAVTKAPHANKAFMVVAADPLSLIALKPPSKFGAYAVVDWIGCSGSECRCGLEVPQLFTWPPA